MKRSSGILMPVSSLPSPYGIGTLGKCAYDFIDFLREAGQSWWQILPLGLTDMSGSPYSSASAFAGNPDYIDLDLLAEDGLADFKTMESLRSPEPEDRTDFSRVTGEHGAILRAAFENGRERYAGELAAFRSSKPWMEAFALFTALKGIYGGKPWYDWPEDIRTRRPEAVSRLSAELRDEMDFCVFEQFLFFRQWAKLREYAHQNGIGIIGDVPIYVAGDSADVWSEPWFFKLGADYRPTEEAGVPPDYFSADGQLWGNPIYDWDKIRADGWGWWIRRIDGASKLYDVVRIDHFRAFASYWAVPGGEKTAKNGHWCEGPGIALVSTLKNWFADTEFIAEDLGILTPDVGELLEQSGLPGMKVLEFAFSPDGTSAHLPHRFSHNCVCYSGTHDNNTVLGWLEDVSPEVRRFAARYIAVNQEEGWCWGMLRAGMSSVADVYISQMQDLLEKPGECRMNTPGTQTGNWRWRMLPGECAKELTAKLLSYTKLYGRENGGV